MPEPVTQLSQYMQPDWVASAGVWVGLVVALLVFSAILGDHWLARLGQAILVGAGLGYAAAVTWHAVIGLPVVQGLLANPIAEPWNWIPVVLAALLVLAAGERILFQGEGGPPAGGFRRVLRWGGVVPAALLLAAGIAVVAVGAVQGTLLPQFLAAAAYWHPLGRRPRRLLHRPLDADRHGECAGLLGIGPAAPHAWAAELGAAPDAGLGLVWPTGSVVGSGRALCAAGGFAHVAADRPAGVYAC